MLQLVWWCKVQKYRSQGIHGCTPTQCGLLIYNVSNTLQWAVRRGSRWSSFFYIIWRNKPNSKPGVNCWVKLSQLFLLRLVRTERSHSGLSEPRNMPLNLRPAAQEIGANFCKQSLRKHLQPQTPSCLWWLLWAEEISPKAVSARSHVPSICQWIDWLLFWIGF